MSEAVTVPSLMMVTVIVSEDSLAGDRQTHTHTHTSILTFSKTLKTNKNKVLTLKTEKKPISIKKNVCITDISAKQAGELAKSRKRRK